MILLDIKVGEALVSQGEATTTPPLGCYAGLTGLLELVPLANVATLYHSPQSSQRGLFKIQIGSHLLPTKNLSTRVFRLNQKNEKQGTKLNWNFK